MDTIRISNLIFRGNHGCFEEERKLGQPFTVSLEITCDTRKSAGTDTLADTVDYGDVRTIVEDVIGGPSCALVEKLAERIATRVLRDERIAAIEVTISKPEIWENGIPSVTIRRTRDQ